MSERTRAQASRWPGSRHGSSSLLSSRHSRCAAATPDAASLLFAGMMVAVRALRPSRFAVDVTVSLVAALATASGVKASVAAWLPHSVIVPIALGQGLLLLARRRAPMAVLAALTPLGVFLLAVGYPALAAVFATGCAAYALAVYRRRARGADLAGTLRSAAPVLVAAVAMAVAGV